MQGNMDQAAGKDEIRARSRLSAVRVVSRRLSILTLGSATRSRSAETSALDILLCQVLALRLSLALGLDPEQSQPQRPSSRSRAGSQDFTNSDEADRQPGEPTCQAPPGQFSLRPLLGLKLGFPEAWPHSRIHLSQNRFREPPTRRSASALRRDVRRSVVEVLVLRLPGSEVDPVQLVPEKPAEGLFITVRHRIRAEQDPSWYF